MQSLAFVDPALKKWNVTFEANGGTDYAGIGRLGLVWNTSFAEGNAFALKLYPVATRDHDAHASRPQDLFDGVRYLRREPLLHLKAASKHFDEPRQLRQPEDPSRRDVGDMRLPEERKEVVLAQ